MAGWGWSIVIHPDDLARMLGEWKQSLSTGAPFETTFPIRGKDGSFRTFFARAAPLIDASGQITKWFGTNTDVTEIADAKRSLEDASRRKDEFLAMLAHELRNPLAPVATAAQLLAMPGANNLVMSKASEIISRQVTHMTRLIDDLLDVSRVTRGLVVLKPEVLDVRDVILPAIEQVQPLMATRGHSFVLQIPDAPVFILGDKARYIQIISNLLNNAAKYTDPAGNIGLDVSVSEVLVTISIIDDGTGIAPELMPHLFDLFSQGERSSDRSQGGLGLGLSLVKSLVELSGGKVTVRSKGLNCGSVFEVILPRAAVEFSRTSKSDDAPSDLKHTDALSILVVDDNIDAVDTLSIFLRIVGHNVQTAHSGKAALTAVRNTSFDIVFLDIGLPDIDGYALARRLRLLANTSKSLLVAVTGYGQPEDKKMSRQAGCDHHLVKPVSLEQVREVVSNYSR